MNGSHDEVRLRTRNGQVSRSEQAGSHQSRQNSVKSRDVNKTFFQDQDQDFCFKTKTKTKTSEIFQDQDLASEDQDQDLHTVSGNPKTVTSNAPD